MVMDCALSPASSATSKRPLAQGHRPHRAHPGNFRPKGPHRRGRAASGARPPEYQRSRLVRSWTHLERQRGGFGFLGGPGETQIETDRRLIGERIVRIERELRQLSAGAPATGEPQRVPYPIVALVGYTNAGKSTPVQSAHPRRT